MIKIVRFTKKGNVILITICVVVALLILLVSFLKSTTNRVFTTKKLGNITVAREFANSLAILVNNYIKNNEIKDPDGDLRKVLKLAYNDMASKKTVDITAKFKTYINENVVNTSGNILDLLEKGSGLKDLKWTAGWCITKDDFHPINIGKSEEPTYPREKTGLIRYYINISYVPPGAKSATTEDYVFISSISVIANIFPVLSKFNFYVEDALGGDSANDETTFRFNVIDTLATGDLKNGATIRPWVLNNGEGSNVARNTYNDLVSDPRGFVYMGGGTKEKPLLLGIARGWGETGFGKYGEDFHFFKNENRKAGYWKTLEVWNPNERKGIMTANIGMCNDVSDDNLLSWHEQLTGFYEELSKYHSIFKLYGTDGRKSPTMVLGYVDSLCDSIRMFKNGTDGVYFLSYINTYDEFMSGLGYEINGWEPFGSGYTITPIAEEFTNTFGSNLTFETYNEKLSSRLLSSRYNNDYTYILTDNMVDYPIERSRVTDDKLIKLCNNNEKTLLTSVPSVSKTARYADIFGEDLTDLSKFLNKESLFIDGSEEGENNSRLLCSVSAKSDEDIKAFLKDNDYLVDNSYDLNGFIYFASEDNTDFVVDKCKVISNGGIILPEGNIIIKGDIDSVDNAHLTLAALNGDIIIERAVQNINASLIAGGGQVKLEGDGKDSELTINGNIIMKSIKRGSIRQDDSIGLKRGLYLNYKNELSAIPYNASQDVGRSEAPLLMYGLKDDLLMLD